jgi:hypothetical protein
VSVATPNPPVRPDEPAEDDLTLDERVSELEALIEEARQLQRKRRRRNAAIALVALGAAGAAVYVGGDGLRAGEARSAERDPTPAATPTRPGTWSTPTGPPGFHAEVVLHPSKPGALYLSAGGRVYRSTDFGRSWKAGPPIALKVDALAVDPRSGSILYAGTNDGVQKSTDGGRTWRRSGLRPSPGRSREYADVEGWVYSIAVDPADSRNVYASVLGIEKNVNFRSHDAGVTWRAMRPGMTEIHPAGSGILYTVGGFGDPVFHGVLRSTDGGSTWQGVLEGSWSLAVDPHRAGTVWAVGERVLHVTRDGGTTWRSAGSTPAGDVSAIALDPRRPRTLYLSTRQDGAFRSVDDGRTWHRFGARRKGRAGLLPGLTELLAIDSRGQGTVYAGDGFGVVATADGGASWRRADAGVVASQVGTIAPAASNAATIYTGGISSVPLAETLSRSDDRGRTWVGLQSGAEVAAFGFGGALAVDPQDHRHVLVGGRGIFRSRDGGTTWTSHLRRPNSFVGRIAFAASDPRQAYATVFTATEKRFRVLRSSDGGETWKVAGTARFDFITGLAVHPKRAATVYVGYETSRADSTESSFVTGGGVAISSDGGRSWRRRSLEGETPSLLAIAPSDPDTIYASTGSGLARSVDGGDRWQLVPLEGRILHAVVVDPRRSETVYVGTLEHGVLRSTDGGMTWRPFGPRLPRQDVRALAFDPSGTWLYAGMGDGGLTSIRVR